VSNVRDERNVRNGGSVRNDGHERDVFRTAYALWRCREGRAMGAIGDQLPANCPSCDAPREELYYWAED